MSQRDDDIAALQRLIVWAEVEDHEEASSTWVEAFIGMLVDLENGKWPLLTEKQRAWVRGVTEKVFDEPTYSNDWSSGKVPRGLREVETPAILRNLPKKPPRPQ